MNPRPNQKGLSKMSTSLYDLKQMAREELRNRWENYQDEFYQGEPHDVIHEIADGMVPVYYSQLIDLAGDNHSLAVDVPELGPAFDGEPTPVNIIAANVFEAIDEACWEEWREIESERELA